MAIASGPVVSVAAGLRARVRRVGGAANVPPASASAPTAPARRVARDTGWSSAAWIRTAGGVGAERPTGRGGVVRGTDRTPRALNGHQELRADDAVPGGGGARARWRSSSGTGRGRRRFPPGRPDRHDSTAPRYIRSCARSVLGAPRPDRVEVVGPPPDGHRLVWRPGNLGGLARDVATSSRFRDERLGPARFARGRVTGVTLRAVPWPIGDPG